MFRRSTLIMAASLTVPAIDSSPHSKFAFILKAQTLAACVTLLVAFYSFDPGSLVQKYRHWLRALTFVVAHPSQGHLMHLQRLGCWPAARGSRWGCNQDDVRWLRKPYLHKTTILVVDPRWIEPEDGLWDSPVNPDPDDDYEGLFTAYRQQQHSGQTEGETVWRDGIEMDNPILLRRIKTFLTPPTSEDVEYNLADPEMEDPSEGSIMSSKIVPFMRKHGILNISRPGVFFEAGALDGEQGSKTLYLERFYNWTGLLVEMTRPNAKLLTTKGRKAWIAPVCISPEPRPTLKRMKFVHDPQNPWAERTGTLSRLKWSKKNQSPQADAFKSPVEFIHTVVKCFPLYSLLLASGVMENKKDDSERFRIDLLALDLEGVDLQVLKTLPWDKLDVAMIIVDIFFLDEGKDALVEYLTEQLNYRLRMTSLTGDYVFCKRVLCQDD